MLKILLKFNLFLCFSWIWKMTRKRDDEWVSESCWWWRLEIFCILRHSFFPVVDDWINLLKNMTRIVVSFAFNDWKIVFNEMEIFLLSFIKMNLNWKSDKFFYFFLFIFNTQKYHNKIWFCSSSLSFSLSHSSNYIHDFWYFSLKIIATIIVMIREYKIDAKMWLQLLFHNN